MTFYLNSYVFLSYSLFLLYTSALKQLQYFISSLKILYNVFGSYSSPLAPRPGSTLTHAFAAVITPSRLRCVAHTFLDI